MTDHTPHQVVGRGNFMGEISGYYVACVRIRKRRTTATAREDMGQGTNGAVHIHTKSRVVVV